MHNSSKPASDLAGEMSAALSAIAKAFKMHGTQAGFRKSLFEDDKGSSFLDFQGVVQNVKLIILIRIKILTKPVLHECGFKHREKILNK